MKRIIFLLLSGMFISISCKKEPDPPLLMFLPSLSGKDLISWDSVSYTTINYSYQNELIDDELNNPEIYSNTVNLDLRTEYLQLEANQVIVIKKFDMMDKSGKILYYIPFSDETTSSGTLKLPWHLKTGEGKSNYAITVIRYSE